MNNSRRYAGRLFLALAFTLITTACFADISEKSRSYTFRIGGKEAGTRTITRIDENHWRYHFEFNDRGRGPDLVSTLETNDAGIPVAQQITGKSYFKDAVDESFGVREGTASWRNRNEQGSGEAGGFYVALNEVTGKEPLLRALLQDDDGRIPLLPSGEAVVRVAGQKTVARDGEHRELTLYAISGLGFSPHYEWATADGKVFYDGWGILQGWGSVADELDAYSSDIKSRHYAAVAKKLVGSQSGALLVTNARLFDPFDGTITTNASVLVRNGRIVSAGASLPNGLPEDIQRVDAGDRFLMPGLYDMHVHNFGDDGVGLEHLAGGVTTVRDLAAPIDHLVALRSRWESGETLGPRVHMGGFIDSPGKYAGPSRTLVDTREEALAAVNKYANLGYAQIKLYNSIRHELLEPIIETAHEAGMKVSGHIPVHVFAEEAVDMGYDEIQHINHLFLNFMDRGIDNRTPARFTEVAEHGTKLELRSEDVKAFIRFLKENDTVIDPTLAIFETSWVSRPGDILPPRAPVADRLPPMVLRDSLWSGLPVPEALDEAYKASFRQAQAFVKALHDAGVRIAAGTDFMPGFALHRELELYAEAGIPNADVLRIATLGAAEIMEESDRHGRIVDGAEADFILIDGNPLEDMSDIRNVTHVVRAGKLLDAQALQAELGMKP